MVLWNVCFRWNVLLTITLIHGSIVTSGVTHSAGKTLSRSLTLICLIYLFECLIADRNGAQPGQFEAESLALDAFKRSEHFAHLKECAKGKQRSLWFKVSRA
jgi:hypothetical protein